MKIFSFALYATVDTSFGTDLELIQKHLDQGDTVHVFTCRGDLISCDRNRLHSNDECNRCLSKSNWGLSLLFNTSQMFIQDISNLPEYQEYSCVSFLNELERLNNIDELKNITYESFDFGYAIASSLISWKRDAYPNIKENLSFLKAIGDASLRLYKSVDNLLKKEKPDVVYVFQGRYAPMRAIVRACEKNEIKFFTHDRGRDLYHYATYENSLPHDREKIISKIWNIWNSGNSIDKIQISKEWFERRSRGIHGAWISFTKEQKERQLPPQWIKNNRNICIFSSSEHEFASIDKSWENQFFKTQLLGINFIIDCLKDEIKKGTTSIYIRIHPNQANAVKREVEELISFEKAGVNVITPDSKISSYELIKQSNLVITFGSTVGIESVYWGTPSILIGQSFYKQLDATYNPDTKEELKNLLETNLKPKPISLALPYGYYMANLGEPYKCYEPTGFLTGKFKGYPLEFNAILINNIQVYLAQQLNLKNNNYIIFPEWNTEEEILIEELSEIFRQINDYPNLEETTLLIYIGKFPQEEAELIISSIILNLMLEENIDLSESLQISFVPELNIGVWEILLSQITSIIHLEHENQSIINQLSYTKPNDPNNYVIRKTTQ